MGALPLVQWLTLDKPVKIVHVYKDFCPPVHGGMERHIALLCRYQKQWASVEALVCSRRLKTTRHDHEGVTVTAVGEWGRFQSAPFSPAFPWAMRRSDADLMVVHCPNPTAELGWLLGRPRGALIVRYQSDVVRQAAALRFYAPFQRRFLSKADLILATSPQYVASSSLLQHFSEKCRVVPLGIVAEDYVLEDPAAAAALQQQYGAPYVFFCGVHRYYKGLQWLVRAAKKIDAPVVIAGDGPERESLIALAVECGVKIFFPGYLCHDALVAHLHGCAVAAFPSSERSEAFGLSMLEAHACARPVVATRLDTGVTFVNEDGKTGLNVAPKDADALADALNTLLRDAPRRAAMGAYARERVQTQFSAEKLARQEFEIYEEVLAARSA